MLEVCEPGALNCYTLSRLIPLTLFVSRNLTSIYLRLSGSLDSLLCYLIAPTPGLAFSSDTTHPSSGVMIFVRQGISLSELSSLDLNSNHVGVYISLNNSLLSFLNVYASSIRSSPKDSRTDSFSPPFLSLEMSILGDFNCHHSLWDSKGTSDPSGEEVSDWVISDLFPLNDPDTPTLLHRSFGSRFSPDIFFAPSSLAPGRCFRTCFDHLPSFFHCSERLLSFNFQKSRWSDCFLLRFSLPFRRGKLVSFLCCCSLHFSDTDCGQIFHLFRAHQTPTSSLVVR